MFKPNYTITNRILKGIGTIEACREVIANAPLVPAWEARFREEAIIRTVHYGTHLEGNDLNLTEAARVVELAGAKKINDAENISGVVGKQRDIQEVINYRKVIEYIDGFEKKDKIDEKVIKKIHKLTTEKILEKEEVGNFRKTQVVVKNSKTGEVTFRPPPAIEIYYQIKDFLKWLESKEAEAMHPVIAAGIVHYEIVRIHPFIDGNGRVARAVALLYLYKTGYDVKRFFSLEEHYDSDAASYYKALQSVDPEGKHELTGWLEYFCEGLAVELERVKEKVLHISRDLKLKEKIGEQIALSERQLKLIDYIQSYGFIQNQAFGEVLPMVSEDTVLRDLKDLIKKGIIKKEGSTKKARYIMG